MDPQHELQALGELARRCIEPGLSVDACGAAASAGSCLHAALMVTILLKRFGPGHSVVRGGRPEGAGARDVHCVWQGHYWVEVQLPAVGVFIVDIVADQFGYEPVVVLPLEQAHHRYRAGPQREVDEAFEDLVREFGCRNLVAA